MKKIKNIVRLLILITIMTIIPVNAANYELKELIPVNVETTIVTKHFSYRGFYYNDNKMEADQLNNNFIIFKGIKNISDEELPVTISVAFFDSAKKNIGTINYCSKSDKASVVAETILKPGEEKPYVIEVNKKYLQDGKTVNDIKYISVLSENEKCRITGSQEYIGQTVEEIGIAKNTVLDSQTQLLLKILTVIAVIGVIIFVYQFGFTRAYQNIDGNDVRQGFKRINQELKEEREYQERVNPTPPPEKKQEKTDKVIAQEKQAREEPKDNTDLHNLYK